MKKVSVVERYHNSWVKSYRETIIHKLNPDIILNISNVPYLFKKKHVVFFLHQRYYIDNTGLKYTRGSFKFKIKLKSLFFKTLKS